MAAGSRGAARILCKNYRIDMTKLERARRILGTQTEIDTIHRALDIVAEEAALVRALRQLTNEGTGHIQDVHGE